MNFTDGVGFYDGSNPWDVNNVYELPSEFLKYGEENIIAVRMCNSSGGGGWYEGPIGVYSQAAYNKAYGKASVYAPEDVQEAVLALVEKQIAAIEAEDIDAYAATLDVDYFESGFDKERRLDQMKAWFEAYDNLDVVFNEIVKGGNFIISTHPHRWTSSATLYAIKTVIFKIVKSIAKLLIKIPLMKRFMSRFYYLAKKI